jgi:hypothetical protein
MQALARRSNAAFFVNGVEDGEKIKVDLRYVHRTPSLQFRVMISSLRLTTMRAIYSVRCKLCIRKCIARRAMSAHGFLFETLD